MTTYQHPGSLERPAALHACRRCDHPVLRAVVDGLDVAADPWVLTAAGELNARIQTRDVFTGYCDNQLVLAFRFARHVQGEKGRPVFASHSCAAPPVEFDLDATRAIAEMFASPTSTTEEEVWA